MLQEPGESLVGTGRGRMGREGQRAACAACHYSSLIRKRPKGCQRAAAPARESSPLGEWARGREIFHGTM